MLAFFSKKQWSEDELRDCFYVFDSDGNGFIDMDELFMACKMLGCNDQQAEKQAEVKCPYSLLHGQAQDIGQRCPEHLSMVSKPKNQKHQQS